MDSIFISHRTTKNNLLECVELTVKFGDYEVATDFYFELLAWLKSMRERDLV